MDLVVGENTGRSSTTSARASWWSILLLRLDLGESGLEAALQLEDFFGDFSEKSIKLSLRVRVVLVIIFGELEISDSSLDLVEAILEQVFG